MQQWRRGRAFASHADAIDRGSIPGRDRPTRKTGSDSSTAKRPEFGASVTGPRR